MTCITTTPCGVNATVRSYVTPGSNCVPCAPAGGASAPVSTRMIAARASMPDSRVAVLRRAYTGFARATSPALTLCADHAIGGREMRKVVLTMAGLAALVTTSVAVAHGIEGAKTAKAVAATFSASAGTTSSRTCTTTDGKAITVTDGKYTGTAAGDTDLAGAITLRVRSVINTTDKVGTVNGAFRIEVSGRDTVGAFS